MDFLAGFHDYLNDQKGVSANTVESYLGMSMAICNLWIRAVFHRLDKHRQRMFCAM